ncbi:hypothetical protein [Yinghuangia sp. YIM S10712]|uniref:hypothetical protein n=1 Tax=Yinghuangia sp. YIM S10712 TaxID=3436930 RepID=UPI003F5382AE
MSDEESRRVHYRPFVARLLDVPDVAAATPQPGPPVERLLAPLMVLVAWGSDPAHASVAARGGAVYVSDRGFRLRESLTSYGGPMRAAPLVRVALTTFFRRDVTYDRAWWLVPHSAISPQTMARARTDLQQQWNDEAARAGEFRSLP